jgi:hypothetical protein
MRQSLLTFAMRKLMAFATELGDFEVVSRGEGGICKERRGKSV